MRKQILGSAVATLAGWIVGFIVVELVYGFGNGWFLHPSWYLIRDALVMLPMMGIFIVPVWLIIVLPLYLLVPKRNLFWNPIVCGPLGTLVGFLMIQGFFAYSEIVVYHSGRHAFDIVWPLAIPGGMVGGTTAIAATFSYWRFNQETKPSDLL